MDGPFQNALILLTPDIGHIQKYQLRRDLECKMQN